MIAEFLILLGLAVFAFYKWSVSTFDFFAKRNIAYDKPFPLLGSQKDLVFRKETMYDHVLRLYNQFDTKVFGLFEQRNPVFAIRDPTIIKEITVKGFDHFTNHRTVFSDSDGGLFGNSLISMRNQKWKDMRSTLSPVFTGSKMRLMFTLMNEVASNCIDFLKKDLSSDKFIDLNIKDYFNRFSNDVIASTVFGLQVNTFEDDKNEFYLMGKKVTKFTKLQTLKFFMFANFRYLMRLLKMDLFDKEDTDYFIKLVMGAMKYRMENKIVRHDMINMLMEANGMYVEEQDTNTKSTPENRKWSDEELVAQCFLFFFAGFETTALLMAFVSHELMENPDCQEKLRQEIREVQESLDGKPLTYEALQGMKYLDMVVSETLRKWPPAVLLDRQCNADFTFTDGDVEINIKEGEIVWIPVVGFHMDEQYFPNPTKFDPERFSDENKGDIKPFTYLPFGSGPRNCIGNRFALLETKAILYHLVSEFNITASPKSIIPLKLDATSGLSLQPKNGFWLKLVQLSDST